ncbi:hypothetical protein U0C82_07880 [Fulvimarina sp. 2208YS6-2-32]|uniref:Chemotaxis protein MotC n=1 Tax=Fulvimarina uroteuthidis TaxID=3098149 RepID=A0ABU5I1P5_9HYPH|nr:hypothetical protein [Fulvimarina sp. 2208YS6-2-32]MDY8109062.1 hypothetical protein [Fulvimarina sp. 2208YS6-2-32]
MTRSSLALSLLAGTCLALAALAPVHAAEDAHGEATSEEVRAAAQAARGEEPAGHADDEAEVGEAEAAEDAHGDDSAEAGVHWQTERPPMPFEVVRSLQYLQDQAARGNTAALKVQRRLLAWFGPSLSHRAPEIWQDKRNVRAVALFVLSGGPAEALRDLRQSGVFEAHDEPMIDGILAYAANRTEEAEAKLSAIDLSREETIFAAQINLALAQLREIEHPDESLRLLENVMLAAPGTLLDEAALRLGVLLAENAGKTEKADRYARQYFDRYASSIYAGNFRARFSAVYSDRPRGSELETLETMADTLRLLPDEQRLAMYLSVSRRSLVGGNLELAGQAAQEALRIESAAPADRQRALLYHVASTLSGRDQSETLTTLAAIDDALLHPSDLALKNAAMDVVNAIREPATIASAGASSETPGENQTLARAESLINAIDNDLKTFAP